MNLFKILERCRENAVKFEGLSEVYNQGSQQPALCKLAAADWRTLEKEIGEELDREQAWLLKEKGNAPPPSSAE